MKWLLFFALFSLSPFVCDAQNVPIQQTTGGYRIEATHYQAGINKHGMLDSLKLGDAELLKGAIRWGNEAWDRLEPTAWRVLKTEQPDSAHLTFTLLPPDKPGIKPVVIVSYFAEADKLHVTFARQEEGYGSVAFPLSEQTLAAQPQPRPGFNYKRLPGNGLTYALPTPVQRQGIYDLRYTLANNRAIDVYYRQHDAPYNRQSNGGLSNDRWGRALIDKKPLEFIFAPVQEERENPPRLTTGPLQRNIPIRLQPEVKCALYTAGKPIVFQLFFADKKPLTGTCRLSYRMTNFWDKPAGQGELTIAPQDVKDSLYAFEVKPKETGWFRLVATLTPQGSAAYLPSQDEAEFGVCVPKPGLINPPVPTTSVALTAALGLRCVRGNIVLAQEFPSREKSPLGNSNYDWKRLDEIMTRNATENIQYKINGFCLLDNRPQWANPADFEQLIRVFVARYKDRYRCWEIENEPNGRYKPEDYVTQALAPAYQGAHAADPNCIVMGPGIVRVDLNWFERFFKAGGAKVLDNLSTHTYIGHNRSWEEHGNKETLRSLRKMMTEYGIGEVPVWQTEQGFTFDNHADMPRLQAAYTVRMIALAASVGIPIERFHYFYTEYHGFEPWYLFDTGPNRGGMAVRVLAEQTAGMKFVREIDMGRYAHGITYSDGKQSTALLWTDDFTAQVRFRVKGTPSLPVYNIMGQRVPVTISKTGIVSLSLSGYPLYVRLPKGVTLLPLTRFPEGTNYALSEIGSQAEASSYAQNPTEAGNLNDGTWHFDDGQTAQKIWMAKKDAPLPQSAAVFFDKPRRIHTIVAVTPSSNVALPGPRDYALQVSVNGEWKTVREVKNNVTEWLLYARFTPVVADGVRIVIQDLNNGWWRTDKTKYTDMQARVYELEAYGP